MKNEKDSYQLPLIFLKPDIKILTMKKKLSKQKEQFYKIIFPILIK